MNLIRYQFPELSTWSPFDRLASFRDEINRLFDTSWPARDTGLFSGWSPALDLYDEKDRFLVSLELPGMKKEDINLSFEQGTLTVSGEDPERIGPIVERVKGLLGEFRGVRDVSDDAEEGQHALLQIGECGVKDLHRVAVVEQDVALGVTEQAQDLLRGGPFAATFLGAERELGDAGAARVRERFPKAAMLEAYAELYRSIG